MTQQRASTNPRRVLVLGALSAIAAATCRLHAAEGARFVLAARDAAGLDVLAADLRARGAGSVDTAALDLAACDPAAELAALLAPLGGAVDTVYLAYGVLGDLGLAERDLTVAAQVIDTNYRSAALWALAIAGVLERQRAGSLVVIGSVAGDRGRKSNYLYGSTKAGLGVLVQGLAHRLAKAGARAVLVKPGFVDTPMTEHIKGRRGPLWATPEQVAVVLRRAADKGGPAVYAPWFWRPLMFVIRAVPAPIFHRTNL